MFNFFLDQHAITSLHSGFVPGDSTINQLVDIYNTFCKALDDGINAYHSISNKRESIKHFYSGLLVIYLIKNIDL